MSNKFSKKKLSEIKKIFLDEKEKLIASCSKSSANFVENLGGDEVDAVQANIINDIQERLSHRDFLRLRKIKEALSKIDSGKFGLCEECEEPISEKRLLIIPGCAQCISCAEAEEKYNKINGL